ncbi:BMP family ABC transporter substrate-binding protein [Thermococcus argininiproducens]|uniref:BMP family ABC transporter substrate-binding protein n=1 Tax=Thermococcus argininiproducens TaxID=2866384 RepID=A0A9E7SDB3_9EURY|nr:BMP family ABC transporter substrate-binding protein [Thermococcus argininiproducens]USH00610.1 BMP family ABC transporter substrate-binding protein [Thermococcus argininiproducens]
MKNRGLAVFLIGVLLFSVAVSGCIGGEKTETQTTTPQYAGKIAVVYDVGGRGDLSFNDMAYLGASKAAKEFNLELKEVQSNTESDYLPNLRSLAQTGEYNLIIAVGFMMTDAVTQVADEFPDQKFAIVDGFIPDKPNVVSILFKENEGSALIGALAALIAANDGKDKVGAVLGIEIPVLYKFEGGYRFGIKWAEDYYKQKTGNEVKIDLLYTYTGSFTDPAKGKTAAQAQLGQGAWVIYQIAGAVGLGVFDAVDEYLKSQGKEMGPPFAVGVDSAQDWIKPGVIIASMMKRVDVGVYKAVEMAIKGNWQGGIMELGLNEQGVGVSTIDAVKEMFNSLPEDTKQQKLKELGLASEDELFAKLEETRKQVPDWIWQAVAELEEKIKSGEIKVPMATTKEQIEAIRNAQTWQEMEDLAKQWESS